MGRKLVIINVYLPKNVVTNWDTTWEQLLDFGPPHILTLYISSNAIKKRIIKQKMPFF